MNKRRKIPAAADAAPWLLPHRNGKDVVDTRRAPKWWISSPAEAEAFMRGLKGVEVFELGRSAGGRPILAAALGAREELPGRTSIAPNAAIGGGSPAAFYGQGRRKRQSFMYLGAAHGAEFEGSIAALHMLNIALTGRDLRGKRWPRLAEAARQMRLVVVPFFNIDGRERIAWCRHLVGVDAEAYNTRIALGSWKDGRPLRYPEYKQVYPIPPEQMRFMGATYNDNGFNLVYDNGLHSEPQPETRGLLRFLRDERPDCVLCAHANAGSLVENPTGFIPLRFRQRIVHFIGAVSQRCIREGFGVTSLIESVVAGDSYFTFYQTDMIYHACGALPVIVEFPRGYGASEDFDELLDIGLCVLEEMLTLAAVKGFIPDWPQDYKAK